MRAYLPRYGSGFCRVPSRTYNGYIEEERVKHNHLGVYIGIYILYVYVYVPSGKACVHGARW